MSGNQKYYYENHEISNVLTKSRLRYCFLTTNNYLKKNHRYIRQLITTNLNESICKYLMVHLGSIINYIDLFGNKNKNKEQGYLIVYFHKQGFQHNSSKHSNSTSLRHSITSI